MGGDHFLLRGMDKVRCEVALLFTGYNLKRSLGVLGFDELMAKLDEYATLIGVSGISSQNTLFSALVHTVKSALRKVFSVMTPPVHARHLTCLTLS
jgi:hypothetical protein